MNLDVKDVLQLIDQFKNMFIFEYVDTELVEAFQAEATCFINIPHDFQVYPNAFNWMCVVKIEKEAQLNNSSRKCRT